jgi:hypothetical protein
MPQGAEEEFGVKKVMSGVSEMLWGSRESQMTEKWLQGRISNFQYLMYLNTQAGRSFNGSFRFLWIAAPVLFF